MTASHNLGRTLLMSLCSKIERNWLIVWSTVPVMKPSPKALRQVGEETSNSIDRVWQLGGRDVGVALQNHLEVNFVKTRDSF